MAKNQSISVAEAARLFEGLTGGLPQSATELKDSYRAWMKEHHPDIAGKRDPLSLESVQWMNAAYDVLKARDWTKPNRAETTGESGSSSSITRYATPSMETTTFTVDPLEIPKPLDGESEKVQR
jgi:hypothetical protein